MEVFKVFKQDSMQRGKAVARPELGTKRICSDCNAKYYDLNRDPITCPKCGTIFEVAKPAAPEAPEMEDDNPEVEVEAGAVEANAEVISLEDADADVEQASSIDVPDLDDDSNSDDADVFLDDEEDEDSMANIGLDVAVSSNDDE